MTTQSTNQQDMKPKADHDNNVNPAKHAGVDNKMKTEEKKKEQHKDNMKTEVKAEAPKTEVKTEEQKKTESKETKKPEVKKVKKEEAIANGSSMRVSKKHSMYICNYIKNKSVDSSINYLQEVIKFKKVIPFKGEIPHRSQDGVMSGRYPISASKEFIYLLKALKGNIIENGLDLDKSRIYYASASWASRPSRSGGRSGKRTNVILKAKEFPMMEAKK